MRKRCLVSLAVLLLSLPAFSYARGNPSDENVDMVTEVVRDYVQAWDTSNIEKMKKLLHPRARLFLGPFNDSDVAYQSPAQLYSIFKDNQKRYRRGMPMMKGGDLKIISIDITDEIAAVKLEIYYSGSKVTEYFSLMKFKYGWKIVSRVLTVKGMPAQARLN